LTQGVNKVYSFQDWFPGGIIGRIAANNRNKVCGYAARKPAVSAPGLCGYTLGQHTLTCMSAHSQSYEQVCRFNVVLMLVSTEPCAASTAVEHDAASTP